MTGVLAQIGSFFNTLFATPTAFAATEAVDHAVEGAAAAEHAAEAAHGAGIHVVLKAEEVFNLFGFPTTNSLLMTVITTVLLLAFAFFMRSKLALIPGKLQAGVEMLFEGVLNYMTETLESEKLARLFFPLIMTVFLFVLLANELAFLPGVGSILVDHLGATVPLLRAPAADLNMTLALAIIAFMVIEIAGIAMLGFFKYAGKYVNFSSPVNFAVGLIELISNVGRLISFSFRLFGNVFAGEVMIAVALACLPIFATGHRIARWEGALFLGYYAVYEGVRGIGGGHAQLLDFGAELFFFAQKISHIFSPPISA